MSGQHEVFQEVEEIQDDGVVEISLWLKFFEVLVVKGESELLFLVVLEVIRGVN